MKAFANHPYVHHIIPQPVAYVVVNTIPYIGRPIKALRSLNEVETILVSKERYAPPMLTVRITPSQIPEVEQHLLSLLSDSNQEVHIYPTTSTWQLDGGVASLCLAVVAFPKEN